MIYRPHEQVAPDRMSQVWWWTAGGAAETGGCLARLSDQLSHLGFESPLIITFQRALARDPNFVHPTYGAKGLQEGAVGQTYGEVPIGFAQKDARDIAAQGQAGLFLKSQLRLGRRLPWGTLS